jgi:hypothetical protein
MEHRPCETNDFSVNLKIIRVYGTRRFVAVFTRTLCHYPEPDESSSQLSILFLYDSSHLGLGLLNHRLFLVSPPQHHVHSSFPHTCHIPAYQILPVDNSNNTCSEIQIMKLLSFIFLLRPNIYFILYFGTTSS